MINTPKLKQRLSEIYRKYIEYSQQMLDADYRKKLAELRPGERAPEQTKFFFPEDREALDEKLAKFREESLDLLEQEDSEVKKRMTDAPSTDAVNYLTALKLKNKITRTDIDNALERYGDNYTAYNAIVGIAIDNDMRGFDEHILDKLSRGIDDMTAQVHRINAFTVETKGVNNSHASIFDMALDMSIPDYEVF